MSKASEWAARQFRMHEWVMTAPHEAAPEFTFQKLSSHGPQPRAFVEGCTKECLGWVEIDYPHGYVWRLPPEEALKFARWILDTFGEAP